MSYRDDREGVTGDVEPPKLLDQVRQRLRVKHYSLRTEQAYVGWIRRFILANGKRHPREMGEREVEAFLTVLATKGHVAAGTQNQALSALLFLYREVLKTDLPWMASVVRAKRPRRIQAVLSRAGVTRVRAAREGRARGMGGRVVEAFRSVLATKGHVAAGTQHQSLAALRFLYREVLKTDVPWMESVVRAKRPRRIPAVLSREEVTRLLAAMEGQGWLMAALLYGTGMRLMECIRLRVKDVDFGRGEIVVRNGKGGKDRRAPLPLRLRTPPQAALESARLQHAGDLAAGLSEVR